MDVHYCILKDRKCYSPGTIKQNCCTSPGKYCTNMKTIDSQIIIKEIQNRIEMMSLEELIVLSSQLTSRQYLNINQDV